MAKRITLFALDVNIDKNYAFACFEEPGWECARITQDDYDVLNTYRTADIDPLQDLTNS